MQKMDFTRLTSQHSRYWSVLQDRGDDVPPAFCVMSLGQTQPVGYPVGAASELRIAQQIARDTPGRWQIVMTDAPTPVSEDEFIAGQLVRYSGMASLEGYGLRAMVERHHLTKTLYLSVWREDGGSIKLPGGWRKVWRPMVSESEMRSLFAQTKVLAVGPSRPVFEKCGTCGEFHHTGWSGDCRDNSERFHPDDLDTSYGQNGWVPATAQGDLL